MTSRTCAGILAVIGFSMGMISRSEAYVTPMFWSPDSQHVVYDIVKSHDIAFQITRLGPPDAHPHQQAFQLALAGQFDARRRMGCNCDRHGIGVDGLFRTEHTLGVA